MMVQLTNHELLKQLEKLFLTDAIGK